MPRALWQFLQACEHGAITLLLFLAYALMVVGLACLAAGLVGLLWGVG